MIPTFLLHAPAGSGETVAAMGYAVATVGSPLYDIDPGHVVAAVAVVMIPFATWIVRTVGGARTARVVAGYVALAPIHQLAFWLLVATTVAHVSLVAGHGGPGLRVLFLVDAVLLGEAARRLVLGRPWRVLAATVLLSSIGAYWIAVVGGEAPDQVGLLTKLVEITALSIVLRPGASRRRLGGMAASGVTIGLVVITGLTAWVGAFAAAGGAQGHAHDHGAGTVAPPGTLLAPGQPHDPTKDESNAAAVLLAATRSAIAAYEDPTVAAADGYDVGGIAGLDFHASNPAYEHDGRVLDPERPETLVYAAGPTGPVLLGAMFQTQAMGEPGPAVGGPLTTWHGHEQICVALVPPGLSGIVSPLGGCPVGSIAIPKTNEMMHVWTVEGAPQVFGDLDDAWRAEYVASRR